MAKALVTMKTVSHLNDLSMEELLKIRRYLHERFGIGQRGNIIDVAFGLAEEDQRIAPRRRDSVCFYVTHKRKPRAKRDRIPDQIERRLKRGDHFVLARLDTDVIEIGTRQVKATGKPIVHTQSTGPATAGSIVAWKLPGQSRLQWGVITVGHVFNRVTRVPENSQRVQVSNGASGNVKGWLLARSLPGDQYQVDAALVKVSRAELIAKRLMPANVSTSGKKVRLISKLAYDRGRLGKTFPVRTALPLVVARFLPLSDMVPALGTLKYVIQAEADIGVFREGRSGTSWAISRQVAGLQHGGLPDEFFRGWGQALEYVLAWATGKLANQHGLAAADVDLRLIRVV